MSSARFFCVVLAAMWYFAGLAPAAANPNVTEIDPKSVYVCASTGSSSRAFTLYGSDLVASDTTGYTINSDVRVMVRHSGGSFAPARLTSWTSGQLGAEVRCDLASQTVPGSLEFQVVLRGVAGNIFSIPLMAIPSGPPSITRVTPNQRDVGLTGRLDYLVRVVGSNMPDDTKATIGGESAFIGMAYFTEGVMDIWVPTDLRSKPGVYAVQLHNSRGLSNTVSLTIGAIRPNPKAPAWVNALRMSDLKVSIGWARGDPGTDYYQVQGSFASPIRYSNVGAQQPTSAGAYTVTLPSGSSGSMAVNPMAFTNANLLYRVCAGNQAGIVVCSAGVHPTASLMMPSMPRPVTTVPPPIPH